MEALKCHCVSGFDVNHGDYGFEVYHDNDDADDDRDDYEDPGSSLTIVIITKGDPYRGFSGCCIDSSTDNAPNEIHLILIIISVMMIQSRKGEKIPNAKMDICVWVILGSFRQNFEC